MQLAPVVQCLSLGFLFVSVQDGTAVAAAGWPEHASQFASRAAPVAVTNEQSSPQRRAVRAAHDGAARRPRAALLPAPASAARSRLRARRVAPRRLSGTTALAHAGRGGLRAAAVSGGRRRRDRRTGAALPR